MPEFPLKMIYCTGDDQVTYRNTIYTDSLMNAEGAQNVTKNDVYSAGTHSQCVFPAFLKMLEFFSGYQEIGTTTATTELQANDIRIYPVPAKDYIDIEVENNISGFNLINLLNQLGQVIQKYKVANSKEMFGYFNHMPEFIFTIQ
ncbi:MAG: hypothetical protein R2771_14010 [Saprospiraceae bacterium]